MSEITKRCPIIGRGEPTTQDQRCPSQNDDGEAIYARSSMSRTGTREGKSVQRQTTECQELRGKGAGPARVFFDEGISGSHAAKLPRLGELIQAVERGEIKTIYVEHVDRLGRNAADVALHFRRFTKMGVTIRSVHSGTIHPLLGTILAALAEGELEKTSKRVRDSRRDRFEEGRALGLHKYGYGVDDNDRYQIDEYEAQAVRIAFQLYGSGEAGADVICTILNRLGYPAPGGGAWDRTTLLGKRQIVDGEVVRMNGLLCNPMYVGRRIVGASSVIKDENGNKHTVYHSRSSCSTVAHPPIITDEDWAAVQQRYQDLEGTYAPEGEKRPPTKYLLSGLMVCGTCGNGMRTINGSTVANRPWNRTARVVCSASLKGSCKETRGFDMAAVQTAAISALMRLYEHTMEIPSGAGVSISEVNSAQLKRDIARLNREIAEGSSNNNGGASLPGLRSERDEAVALLQRVQNARRTQPQERTFLEKLNNVLRALPRNLNTADEAVRADAEAVRSSIRCIRIEGGGTNEVRFTLETDLGNCACQATCHFAPMKIGAELALASLRHSPGGVSVRDVLLKVVTAGLERKHALRGLRYIEGAGLARENAGLWKWTGHEPLVVGGCPISVHLTWSPIEPQVHT